MDVLHKIIKVSLAEKVFSGDEVTVIGESFVEGEITFGRETDYVVNNFGFDLKGISDIEFCGDLVEVIL